MINNDTSSVLYKTVEGQTSYPVTFEYYKDPVTNVPQLRVDLNGVVLSFGTEYTVDESGVQILVPVTAGVSLSISRNIPFTQTQDYTNGYIDAEQIEKGFDMSVMRDQQLADAASNNQKEIAILQADVDTALEKATSADSKATTASADAASALSKATAAQATATTAETTATQALSKANVAQKDVDALETVVAGKQDKGDYVTTATMTAALAGKQDKGNYATTSELNTGLAKKQNTLSSAQLTAANSGITAAKVTQYDGYNAKIQTLTNDEVALGNQVAAIESKIPSTASASNPLVTKSEIPDALPAQAGNAGKFLTTDGTAASWATVPESGTKVIIRRYE